MELAGIFGGDAGAGWEVLATLKTLRPLAVNPPDGGRDVSFFSALAECHSLLHLNIRGCTQLSNLSTLVSISHLRSVSIFDAHCLHDLRALTELPHLQSLYIGDAPLLGGLAAVVPVLDRLTYLGVWSVPTVTSFDGVAGSSLQIINLADCPATSLEPLSTLQSLEWVWLRQFPAAHLAPLAKLPHLRDLYLLEIDEPVDLSPLAQTDHRIRIKLRNTSAVGTAGPLVKIHRI